MSALPAKMPVAVLVAPVVMCEIRSIDALEDKRLQSGVAAEEPNNYFLTKISYYILNYLNGTLTDRSVRWMPYSLFQFSPRLRALW